MGGRESALKQTRGVVTGRETDLLAEWSSACYLSLASWGLRGLLEECFCGVDSWQQWVLPTETSDPQDEGIHQASVFWKVSLKNQAGMQVGE